MIGEHDKENYVVIQVYTGADGGLACSIKVNGKEKHYRHMETKQILKELDKEAYDSVNLTSDSIRLKAEDALLVIYDVRDMYKRNAFELMPNTFPKIQREVARHNRRVAQNRTRKNQQRGRQRFAATALTLVILASTIGGLGYHNYISRTPEIPTISDVFNDPKQSPSINDIIGNIESGGNRTDSDALIDEYEEVTNPTYLNFRPTSDLEKKEYAYEHFYDMVQDEAIRYGMSPNLPMAMLTQESGGKEDNLMQIEFDQWLDMKLRIYNFLENKYDYYVLTDNPNQYNGTNYRTISRKDILDPRTNIRLGCAMLRVSSEMENYHILAGVQCYNLGVGNMQNVLEETARRTDQTVDEILADQTNTSFTDYTYLPGVGDKDYLSHVFQYLDPDDTTITLKHRNSEGEIITEEITLYSQPEKGLY